MRVIMPSPEKGGWSKVVACDCCAAVLQIQRMDLYQETLVKSAWSSDRGGSDYETILSFVCPCCSAVNNLPASAEDKVPAKWSLPTAEEWRKQKETS